MADSQHSPGSAKDQANGMTVPVAAQTLGISENAVRKRIQHGTIRSELIDNRRIVYLPTDTVQTERGLSQAEPVAQPVVGGLVEQLQSENQFLRDELEARREAERELRVLVAQQSAQLVEMAGQVRVLEAGPAPSGSMETVPSPDNNATPAADDTDESEQPGSVIHRFWRFLSGPS